MNKKIFTIGAAALMAVSLAGCGSSKAANNSVNAGETKTYADSGITLTDEQRTYLAENERLTDDAISQMSRETIDWYLLGTGLELYNATSGAEKNGVTYDADSAYDYTKNSDSSRSITMEEAVAIRDKDTNMKVEDFADYSYEVEEKDADKGAYLLKAPVDGYKDTFIYAMYFLNDGKVKMNVPYVYYKDGADSGYTFSIIYDYDSMNTFFENGDCSFDGKIEAHVIYTTVTDGSLIASVANYTDKDYELDGSYKIIRLDDDDKDAGECASGKTDAQTINAGTMSIVPVVYDATLEKGRYRLELGDLNIYFDYK